MVNPGVGYGIGDVLVNGTSVGVPQGQLTPFTQSVSLVSGGSGTLAASFLPLHNITTSVSGTGGSIDPSLQVLDTQGTTITITPASWYRILSLTDNGVPQAATPSYVLTNVTANHNIVASFMPSYTITASAGPNGTISPIGVTTVDGGSSRNYSLTANYGYKVSTVSVDGVSIDPVTNYTFTAISANHTIAISFEAVAVPNTYCAIPPFIATAAPPNVMLMLSVETPMSGPANPTVTCTGNPASLGYSCSSSGLGTYDDTRQYYGYFENGKCYSYTGSGATGVFTPSATVTTGTHQCAKGSAWSGNMLNWSTAMAVDTFRKAYTGGNRAVDSANSTVILAATNNGDWNSDPPALSNAEYYMPVSGTGVTRQIMRTSAGIGFVLCPDANTCNAGRSGSGQAQWPTTSTFGAQTFSLRIAACSTAGGTAVESRCNSSNNKPEGTIQKYMNRMRFALMSYAADSDQTRDGGVLRSNMKWVTPTIPNGYQYNSGSSTLTCSTTGGCSNPEAEVDANGIFIDNPAGASGANSGIINYINQFAYTSGYKSYDPSGEMFYQVVRYFMNLAPSVNKYCSGYTSFTASYADGFAYYCNPSKTNSWGWRDPALYSCSQNFVIGIQDANPWLDKRIPGSAFIANYGGSAAGGSDYCSASNPCDTDFTLGGTQVDVAGWTDKVGNDEGLTGYTMNVACEVDGSGACIGGFSGGKNVTITHLSRIIGTPPYPGKENSYNIAGLAYFAHLSNLRPDLPGTTPKNLTTYLIDTQEANANMLVGPRNMLWLAAKYGGFVDKDGDGKPFNDSTCGGVSSTPNALCSEWDADNTGTPDTYFLASDSSRVEDSLNKAFDNMLNRAASGTAAAVANNKSGQRGANIIQALFYPQWPLDKNVLWLGEAQALWYYLDPIINYSTVREDTDQNDILDLTVDKPPGSDPFQTQALWKAGVKLQSQSAASRNIYTLLSSSTNDLTDPGNAFSAATGNLALLKPLLNASSLSDTQATQLINWVRGVDAGTYRSRTVTYNGLVAPWKLGDVINSTPQIQSNVATNAYHTLYNDTSYATFIGTNQYKSNNVVYTGVNDGMLHAFRLGQVQPITNDPAHPFRIASVVNTNGLGQEEWAFIPNNALPYLQNLANANYCHQYLVDGAPLLVDASINRTSGCGAAGYWLCDKTTATTSANDLIPASTSWKSVLIGSMGLGGASRDGNCNETLNHDADATNNLDCTQTPVTNRGFSSYFALDVTAPLSPKYLWEFSDAVLPYADNGVGLTTPGPALVRINARTGTPALPDRTKNGRWFAVFASGPTGTIDTGTRSFLGRSDQNLKLYVVDLNPFDTVSTFNKCTAAGQTNCNYWVFDTGIKYGFANSLTGASVDLDRSDSTLPGNYSDDAVYITYTKATLDGNSYPTDWDLGGVVRLVTNNDPDPSNWFVAKLIDNVGAITTSVARLQDRNNKKLWIFFGEGRYFYPGDDLNVNRKIFGVADPCYNFDAAHANSLSSTLANCPAVQLGDLVDQTSTPGGTVPTGKKGWYIDLAAASGSAGAERVSSDVTASFNGIVFYTTYIPNTDACSAGGNSSLWAVNYNTGGKPSSAGLSGKIPLQTSSGSITMIDLGSAMTQSGGRNLSAFYRPAGMAPKGPARPLLHPKPTKQILNIQER